MKDHRPTGSLAAFRHRDFVFFWGAGLISQSAQWMQQIIVPVIVYRLTGSNTWVGLIGFSQLIPAFLIAPAAGVIADRILRVRVLRYTTAVQFLVAIMFMLLWLNDSLSPFLIVMLSLVYGLSAGIQFPNWQSMVPLLVPPQHMFSAIRLNSAQFKLAPTLGPAIGVIILSLSGETAVFLTNALTYLLFLFALLSIRSNQELPSAPAKVWQAFKEGIRFVRKRIALLQAISTGFVVSMLGQSLTLLVAGLVRERYEGGVLGVSGFITANGIGAIIAIGLLIRYGDRYRISTTIKLGMLIYAIGPVLIAATTFYTLGVIGYFLNGVAHMFVAVSINIGIQSKLPDKVRGRVTSIYLMGVFGGIPLGALIGGSLGDVFGLERVFTGYGIAIILYLAVVLIFYKGHKLLDRDETEVNKLG